MPLTEDEERLKLAWEVAQMDADIRLKDAQTKWEPWKVLVTAVGTTAALFGSIGVLIGYLLKGATH
jgi:hypothetical protein